MRRANERRLAALQRHLVADFKQLTKHLKKEYRSRRQTIGDELDQRRSNLTAEQERDALRQVGQHLDSE